MNTASLAVYLLVVIAATAAVTDLRSRRIPNFITVTGAAAGLALHTWSDGLAGLGFSAAGLLAGCLLYLGFYRVGGLGAGDVKLLGAIGACGGAWFALLVFVFAGLAGGVGALLYAALRGQLRLTVDRAAAVAVDAGRLQRREADRLRKSPNLLRMPYGAFIGLGTLAAIAARV